MKKNILFAAFLLLMFPSCRFLDERNTSYPTAETYYTSAEKIRTGLNGLYDPVRAIYTPAFFQLSECTTDIIYLSSDARPDANCIVSPTKPCHGATVWKQGYLGVMRANELCDVIASALEKGLISNDEYRALYGEAVVMRALYWYVLTSVFGDVPYYEVPVTEDNRAEIAHLGRTDAFTIREAQIDLLKEVLLPTGLGGRAFLPLERSYRDGTDYRAGAAVGLMLAGKFCLWNGPRNNGRWEDAITFFGVLEDIYGHYTDRPADFGTDYPLTDIPFGRKFTPESIFEISNKVVPYGQQEYFALGSYVTPTRATTSAAAEDEEEDEDAAKASDVYNGVSIPELGKYIRTYKSARPTQYFYNQLMTYNGSDLRSGEYSAGAVEARGGSGNLAWAWSGYAPEDRSQSVRRVLPFTDCSNAGAVAANKRPWLGNKFWCFGQYYNRDSNNPKVFRFAGALLGMAEAQLRAGHTEEACKYLSVVRVRAGIGAKRAEDFSSDTESILEAIREECARELFGEFQRKFDLVRWGIWYERAVAYNNSGYKSYFHPYHAYYPIPVDQVSYSGGALDNKAYEEE